MIGRLNNVKAVLVCGLIVTALASIAFLLALNLSPLLITVPHQLGLSRSSVLRAYEHLLLYLQLPGATVPQLGALRLSKAAAQHFADVKNYILATELLAVVSTGVAVKYLIVKKRRQQLWQLLTPLQYLISILVVISTLSVINFADFFIRSHYVLFHNMDWIFSPTHDPIILLMPLSFFSHVFILWIGLLLVFLIVLWGSIWFDARFLKL